MVIRKSTKNFEAKFGVDIMSNLDHIYIADLILKIYEKSVRCGSADGLRIIESP